MLLGEAMIYCGFMSNSMFGRVVRNAISENKFVKEDLETNILGWMPYKVGSHIQHTALSLLTMFILFT